MKEFGADILRLWAASIDYQSDFHISYDLLRQISEAYRKIRNTFRFLLGMPPLILIRKRPGRLSICRKSINI